MLRFSLDWPAVGLVALSFFLAASAGKADASDIDDIYAPYAGLLADFVSEHDLPDDGLISSFDYRAALDHDATGERLEAQRLALASFDPGALSDHESAIAFWLNAYNFFMIAHILENPVDGELISSVRDYGTLFSPYRVFRRELFDVGGRKYSLSEIELDILLGKRFRQKGWKDARVHFAVNCASVGCPPLRRRPYTAGNIERLLEANTRRAFNTALHLRIEADVLYLTSLFDWYEADFAEAAGSVRKFVAEHADTRLRRKIAATEAIRFIEYDWNLNSPENMQAWIE